MTLLARHDGMASEQREARDVVIEGYFLTPAGFLVALLAAVSELGFVRIVLFVTGHAGRRELVAIEIAGVAGVAFDLRVLASQRKLGHSVVVEAHRLPFGRRMAGFALGAVASGMNVLQPMAGNAGHRQVLVALAGMTGRAPDILVGAVKRKLCLAVIERLDPTPAVLAVATVAFVAEALLVGIFRLVTVEAAPRRATESDLGRMAAAALHRFVAALELEVCKGVIERFPIELDNVDVSPLMVGVAVFAFLAQGISLAAMEPFPVPAIGGDVLVARKAEASLRLPRKRLVTVVALLFKLGMSRNQGSGHHQ